MKNSTIKMERIFIIIFFIIIISSIFFYLGSDEQVENFSLNMEQNNVIVFWDKKDNKLLMKKDNIEYNQIKDFSYIKNIKTIDGSVIVKITNSKFNKIKDMLMFGNLLKEELSYIKVTANNMDNIKITTERTLKEYYEKFYPYKLKICDTKSYMYLKNNKNECGKDSHLTLDIDTQKKIYTIKIDYYKDWDSIAERFLNYSKTAMKNEIEKYNNENKIINKKYIMRLKEIGLSGVYYPNILIINNKEMKTKRELSFEMLNVSDKEHEYIEKDLIEDKYYFYFDNNKKLYEDLEYLNEKIKENKNK